MHGWLAMPPSAFSQLRAVCTRRSGKYTPTHKWFRAVDVPVAKPSAYNYKPLKPAQQFQMFALNDCERLEKAFQSSKESEIVETDGLVTVNLRENVCGPTYWDGPLYKVRRALWVEVQANRSLVPVDEKVETELEKAYNSNLNEVVIEWPNVDNSAEKQSKPTTFRGRFTHFNNLCSLTLNDDSWVSFLTKKTLFRGLSEKRLKRTETRPEFVKRRINKLVFCIHGIGQLLSLKYSQFSFIKDVDSLRALITRKLEPETNKPENKLLDATDSKHNLGQDVQVLPIMWRNQLIDADASIKAQQLFGASNVAADAVLDYIMYTEPHHKRKMLETVTFELNRVFHKFCELNPDFAASPHTNVIGHSLGSVMLYEILNSAHLQPQFTITNTFMLGSPLGVLKLLKSDTKVLKGRSKNLYNIMRLTDPIATRLEPLVAPKSLSFSPLSLPEADANILTQLKSMTDELQKNTELLASKASAIMQLFTPAEKARLPLPPASEKLPELAGYNRHGRLDFSAKETLDISVIIGLLGHLMYLENVDVVQFILRELAETE